MRQGLWLCSVSGGILLLWVGILWAQSARHNLLHANIRSGGQGQDYCQAPDSNFEYGPGADANKLPAGGTTRNIPRPKVGNVLYGGEGIYVCTKPGQIAITYDDGPYIYTNELLDMFKSYNFKATFCKRPHSPKYCPY